MAISGGNQPAKCGYCDKQTNKANVKKHERDCYLNPENLVECPVCTNPIKNWKSSKTCGYSCSNTYFRSGKENGRYKAGSNYRTECFLHHGKKCIVCGEEKIVTVHHNDHDHSNNDPDNLIPLCPTHHQYVHSRYKNEVQPIIDKYIQGIAEVGLARRLGR